MATKSTKDAKVARRSGFTPLCLNHKGTEAQKIPALTQLTPFSA